MSWSPLNWLRRRLTPAVKTDQWTFPRFITRTLSGVRIDHNTALSYSAVWACVKIISETVAGLSWHVFRDTGTSKTRIDNDVDILLSKRPNPEMTSFTFREVMEGHRLLWGNAYAEIERGVDGRIVALWPLPPDRMRAVRLEDGALAYEYAAEFGDRIVMDPRNVFHVKGLGYDGISGYSVVSYARQAMGLGLATERFGATFFGNGTRPGGVYEHPGALTEEAHRRLLDSLKDHHGGPDNAHRTLILEEGMKWHSIGVPPEDAQFLETRKFQTVDIARWFRVPPHKIGDLERATFSNIEQQSIEFVSDAIMPAVHRWEQEANTKLLRAEKLISRMNVKSLLRGDTESQHKALQIGFDRGWYDVNEVREFLDLNPIPGEVGRARVMQGAFKSVDDILNPPDPPPMNRLPMPAADDDDDEGEDEPTNGNARTRAAFTELAVDVGRRLIAKERNAVTRALKRYKTKAGYEAWCGRFYSEHEEHVRAALQPVVKTMATVIRDQDGGTAAVDIHHIVNTFTTNYVHRALGRARTGNVSEMESEPNRLAVELADLVGG